jgi:hypothetical protein
MVTRPQLRQNAALARGARRAIATPRILQALARWSKPVRTAITTKKHTNNVKSTLKMSLVTGGEPHTVTEALEKGGVEFAAVTLPRPGFCGRSGHADPRFAVPHGFPHLQRTASSTRHTLKFRRRAEDGFQPPSFNDRRVTRILCTT